LSKLSEKELLEMLSQFPKHELPTEKRTEMLRVIGEQHQRRIPKVNVQRIAALAAMFILVLIAPILYFSNGEKGSTPKHGTVGEEVKRAEEGVLFALMDSNGKSFYADSNLGVPNKVSLLAPSQWIAKDQRSVSKISIYLWGNYEKEFANKPLKIDAVHVETGVKKHLATTVISGGMYGSDGHAMTSFEPFVFPGIWNLEFTAGDKKVGEFSIEVKEPYLQIGKSTLMISKQDLIAGFYEDALLEVEGENLPSEVELELFALENAELSSFTFKDKTNYTTTDGRKISLYKGDFTIKKSGKYRFTVLNQPEAVEVRKP
jgi:hypothetical protein